MPTDVARRARRDRSARSPPTDIPAEPWSSWSPRITRGAPLLPVDRRSAPAATHDLSRRGRRIARRARRRRRLGHRRPQGRVGVPRDRDRTQGRPAPSCSATSPGNSSPPAARSGEFTAETRTGVGRRGRRPPDSSRAESSPGRNASAAEVVTYALRSRHRPDRSPTTRSSDSARPSATATPRCTRCGWASVVCAAICGRSSPSSPPGSMPLRTELAWIADDAGCRSRC